MKSHFGFQSYGGVAMLKDQDVTRVDYLILGAGSIGLQMGSLLEGCGFDYLILESSARTEELFERNAAARQSHQNASERDIAWNQLKISYNTRAFHIDRRSGFEIIDQNGRVYSCRILLIADGLSRGGYFNDTVFARSCFPARRSGSTYPAVTGKFESLNQADMFFLCASAFYGNPLAISHRARAKVFTFILEHSSGDKDLDVTAHSTRPIASVGYTAPTLK